MSSAFFPTNLMSGWFKVVAENNPLSWIINPVRRLVINGWSSADALQALGLPAVLAAVSISAAVVALNRRLATP